MTTSPPEDLIYLDHNATTPVAPEVLDAMLPYLKQQYGNPSSDHPLGHRAHQAIDEARGQVASLIGAEPGEVVFTSGGTESNNLAIRGTAATAEPGRRRIVTSQVEHPATARPCDLLEAQGWTISRVPVTNTGTVDVETVVQALDADVALLTVMLAQNETGAIMPVAAAAAAALSAGNHHAHRRRPGNRQDRGCRRLTRRRPALHRRPQVLRTERRRRAVRPQRNTAATRLARCRPGTRATPRHRERRLHRRPGSRLPPRADPPGRRVASATPPARAVVAGPVRPDPRTGAIHAGAGGQACPTR